MASTMVMPPILTLNSLAPFRPLVAVRARLFAVVLTTLKDGLVGNFTLLCMYVAWLRRVFAQVHDADEYLNWTRQRAPGLIMRAA